jgi:outer membrane protein assembly factor BamA
MRHRILSILLLFCTVSALSQSSTADSLLIAQAEFAPPPDSLFVVEKVAVIGNQKTKGYVLLREMELKAGDYITADALENDRSRIYNLGLFNRVDIGYVAAEPPHATLIVAVQERWYIYPFPIAGIKDRDWKKLYFGAGLIHQNFRGRNEKLYAALVLGYDPAVILSYRNPMIDEALNDFIEAGVAWRVVRNHSITALVDSREFDERHFSALLSIGRRFGVAHTIRASAGFSYVRVSDYRTGRTMSPSGEDSFPVLGLGYTYDTRDAADYALAGEFVRATITKSGVPGSSLDFVRYAGDFRRFVPLVSRLTLAGHVFGDLVAAGPTPSYNRTYFGYDQRIRGHFYEVYEGECQFGASSELRFALLPARYIKLGFIPVPEFSVWKFGVFLAAFADAGTVWFRGEPFALNRFLGGYGAGVHILLPYGFVLRMEYARNRRSSGELILDFTSAF